MRCTVHPFLSSYSVASRRLWGGFPRPPVPRRVKPILVGVGRHRALYRIKRSRGRMVRELHHHSCAQRTNGFCFYSLVSRLTPGAFSSLARPSSEVVLGNPAYGLRTSSGPHRRLCPSPRYH